jgi:hypothetical protein
MSARRLLVYGGVAAFALVLPLRANDFMAGCPRASVIAELGRPLRVIETGCGELLFYGSVFIEMRDGSVIYINVSSPDGLENRRRSDAARGVVWGRGAVREGRAGTGEETGDLPERRGMTDWERREWLAVRRRTRERVLETRVRRFLLTHTFRKILETRSPTRLHFYHDEDPETYAADTARQQRLREKARDLAADASVSDLALRDSRGVRIPAVGEPFRYIERMVDIEEALLGDASPVSRIP